MGYNPWGCKESDKTENLTTLMDVRAAKKKNEALGKSLCSGKAGTSVSVGSA